MSEFELAKLAMQEKEEYGRDTSEVNFVLSFGCKITKVGDHWCCILGDNLQEGHGVFAKSPMGAIERMRAFIYSGIEIKKEGV